MILKAIKKFLYPLVHLYWRIFRPKTLWTRLFLINDNKILLVKHKYHNDLFLPWGWLHNWEEFVSALKRELKEELNLDIIELELFWVYQNMKEYKMDTIVLFISFQEIDLKNISLIDEEIELFMMADINNLPENISPWTKRRIEEFKLKKNPIVGKW